MKKILMLFLLVFTCGAIHCADMEREVLYKTLDQIPASLKKEKFGNRTVAIMPYSKRDDIITGKLKNILTASGIKNIAAKDDPMWNEIIKGIEWAERKNDILDPKTISKFGKLKAAQILLQAKIVDFSRSAERIYAEIELHANDIATGDHIWGNTFRYYHYFNKKIQGIVSLDDNLKILLRKNFTKAENALKSHQFANKLKNVKTVTVIPLAGDIDNYVTDLAVRMLSQTKYYPVLSQITTVSQVKAYAMNKKINSDAILYGAIRDLRRTEPVRRTKADKYIYHYKVYAEIQLNLEDLKSGNILWSDVIHLDEKVEQEQLMTETEINKRAEAASLAAAERANKKALAEKQKEDAKFQMIKTGIIGGVILLVVLIIFVAILLKIFHSYKNVR